MAVEINPPFRVFTDVDGEPLEDGFIHIGAVNQNPQAVPISVFWDSALTIPAAQPIRTLGGYPSRAGSPSRMYVAESQYSISVSNKNGTLIYSDMNDTAGDPSLRDDLASVSDTSKGARLVSWLSSIPGTVARWVSEKLADQLSFKDFGILGDGSNETVKLQAAFLASAGKVLRAEPGKIYFTTDELQIPSGAAIDFCGSRLRYTIDVTGKDCIRFRNCRDSELRNVDIEPIGSMTVAPNTGDSRMPVVVGVYDAHSPTEFCENITIENVKVIGGFDAMNGIAVFGRSNNICIVNPSIEGTVAPASAGIGILAHWSADNISAPTVTYHPRNISIVNPRFRKCALGASAEQASIIFLSGAFNVVVDNVDADDVNTGVYVYPGDFGFTFSNDPAATQVRGVTIDNGSIANVRKFGVNVLGQANGVGPRLPMGVHVRNVRSDGADVALRTRRVGVGVVFDGAAAFGATQGILFSESDDAIAIDCDITGNAQQGVYFASSNRCRLVGSKVYGNNTSNLANQLGSAVYLDGTCADNDICNNHIGAEVATEYYGCRVNGATVTYTKINDNTFYNFVTNVAIQNDAAPYTAKTNGDRNVFAGASLLAVPITPPMIHYDSLGRATVRANAAPVVGTWKVGDRFVNSIPAVGQPKAWSCTVAGTPGTWVSEGNL